jgi:hypothetical protein
LFDPKSTSLSRPLLLVLEPVFIQSLFQALFDKQTEYFDVNVVNETRNNTYSRLSKLAGGVGADEKKIYSLLEISDKPGPDGSLNSGNQVTNDIKLLTKANRLTGVHVTPTVLFNVRAGLSFRLQLAHTDLSQGIVEGGISSGFSKDDWQQWLEKNVV